MRTMLARVRGDCVIPQSGKRFLKITPETSDLE
jgi:hypothetical protein